MTEENRGQKLGVRNQKAPEKDAAKASKQKRASITMANETVIQGEEGDVAVRNSWLINPADVVNAEWNWNGSTDAVCVKTVKAGVHTTYMLTAAEAAELGLKPGGQTGSNG